MHCNYSKSGIQVKYTAFYFPKWAKFDKYKRIVEEIPTTKLDSIKISVEDDLHNVDIQRFVLRQHLKDN
ncbi:MAG: hypothetical protein WCJ01_00165 [Ignavibacteria bacterium]